MVDVARGGDDDVRADVAASRGRRAAPAGVTVEITSARADHRPPERVVAEHRLADQVVHEVLGRVLVHRDLLQHHLALGSRASRRSAASSTMSAHHVERRLEVGVEHAGVDDGVLARGGGVQLPAQLVEDLGDLERASSALEPLNSRCSMKCETPAWDVASRRASPPRSRSPIATERTTRQPLGDDPLARVQLWSRCSAARRRMLRNGARERSGRRDRPPHRVVSRLAAPRAAVAIAAAPARGRSSRLARRACPWRARPAPRG